MTTKLLRNPIEFKPENQTMSSTSVVTTKRNSRIVNKHGSATDLERIS